MSTNPLTNHFCINTTTRAGGSMARMAVAMTTFHCISESPAEIMRLIPMTTGYMFSLVVTKSGQRYWFQP